jgi:acyl-CoA synthetase (AMP-forming)/AMP-acid ligase II
VIAEHARRDPEGLALTDGERRRTWAALADRVRRIARLLRDDLGLRPGDHLAVLLGNRVEGVELVHGAILAGVWVTPVNRHLAPEEVAYVLEDSGASVLVVDAKRELLARGARVPVVLRAGDELERALAGASDEPLPEDGPAGGPMIYTSGTTGRPKGVKRRPAATVRDAVAGQRRYGRSIGLDGKGPHLVTGPLYHAAPLMFAVYDQQNGAPVVLMPRFDERALLATVTEHGVAHTHLVPTMFVRLLRLPDAERAAFAPGPLRVVLHGAAPIAPAVKRRMIAWWGPVLVEYWGGSEGGVTTLVDSADWLAHPGTVGRPLPQWEVFAVDAAGRRLPAGAEGRLYSRHRSEAGAFAYHGDEVKTARAYLPGDPHAFTLGDLGRVDADGFVYLTDREASTIISGGVNIYPAEIERVLAEHPAVADVGVFGVPDDEWGESVKAAVQLAPGRAPSPELAAEILAFARAHLAGYKVPRSIDFEAELPRTPAGKLYVRRLRDRYWQGRERRI